MAKLSKKDAEAIGWRFAVERPDTTIVSARDHHGKPLQFNFLEAHYAAEKFKAGRLIRESAGSLEDLLAAIQDREERELAEADQRWLEGIGKPELAMKDGNVDDKASTGGPEGKDS